MVSIGNGDGAWKIGLSLTGPGSASGSTSIYIDDPRTLEALPQSPGDQFSSSTPSQVAWSLVLPVSGASLLNGGTVQRVDIYTPRDATPAYTVSLSDCQQLPPTPTVIPSPTPTNTVSPPA
jgi:hypothetical protein